MKRILLVLIVSCCLPSSGRTGVPPRPNVLVVLTDDIGWGDYQCYNSQSQLASPNIDRLAREGMRFTRAHTPAALCAPTRYSMLTGNYPWRGRNAAGSWGFNMPSHFVPGQLTVANLLRRAGYHTAMFGKAGFGGTHVMTKDGLPDFTQPMPDGPREWGFDYSFIIPRGHQWLPHLFLENGVAACAAAEIVRGRGKKTRVAPLHGGTDPDFSDPAWDPRTVGSRLLERFEHFLDAIGAKHKANTTDGPFFVHFCTDGAHAPYDPPEEIRGTPVRGETAMTVHTDMVMETDILVGKLRDILERRNLLENTLICVTSDNGGIPAEQKFGHDAVGGLRGMKFTIFEGGNRVPFIVRWTPQISGGLVRNQDICTHDIVPTVLELAGVAIPQDQCLDAVSLVPVLLGRSGDDTPVRKSLLVQSSPGFNAFSDANIKGGPIDLPAASKVRQRQSGDLFRVADEGRASNPAALPTQVGKKTASPAKRLSSDNMAHALYENGWKLVTNLQDEPAALYDLAADPAEQSNLLSLQPERAERMFAQYKAIRGSPRSTPTAKGAASGGK